MLESQEQMPWLILPLRQWPRAKKFYNIDQKDEEIKMIVERGRNKLPETGPEEEGENEPGKASSSYWLDSQACPELLYTITILGLIINICF